MRITTAVLILALLLVTRPAAAGDWRGSTNIVDGVTHVMNPADPMQEPATLAGDELWRIGGDDDEDVFGLIGEILVDDDNFAYLLDRQLLNVLVYDAAGDFVRTIGREGEGPGEFRTPGGMFLTPGGDVAVVQVTPPRIVVFDRDGNALPDVTLPGEEGMRMVVRAVAGGESIFLEEQAPLFEQGSVKLNETVRRIGLGGGAGEVLWETSHQVNVQKITLGSGTEDVPMWEVAADGRLFVSREYNEYAIDVYDSAGRLSRVIEREYEARKRTHEEVARKRADFEKIKLPMGEPEIDIYPTDRDIERMRPRGDELWVMSSRSQLRGDEMGIGAFEVFDADGHYIRNVVLSAEFDRDRDVWFLRGHSLFVIKNGVGAVQAVTSQFLGNSGASGEPADDMGPPEIVHYRVGNALE